ncbi:hypothetical protein [uncultured Amnibacterium sp.]|uniref:hypothetical protein n=1 Tax=uncultured Amnibacterium sp. TaxID=1631851 RepID=UPI0035CAC903
MRRRIDVRDDRGVALLTVIVLGLVMTVLVAAALGTVSSGAQAARSDQDSTGALDAAYSGVQDYLARLNADPAYEGYGNPSSLFSQNSSSSVALPSTPNPAFGFGTSGTCTSSSTCTGTWGSVPGSGTTASFRYETDNSAYSGTGLIRVRSTGRVGSQTRSLVANIRQQGFTEFVWFTDFEIRDPKIGAEPDSCKTYAWAGRASSCVSVPFAPGDVLNGPAHSNDTFQVCGATFNGAVSSSNPNTPIVTTPSGCSAGTYNVGGGVTYSPTITMPTSNAAMKTQAISTGCLYTGPTSITMTSDGKMTVVSPWSKSVRAACGTRAALNSFAGATVNVPSGNAIFVQNIPTSTSDPNYTPTSSVPSNFVCLTSDGTSTATGSSSSAGWKFTNSAQTSKFVQYPMANEVPPDGWDNGSAWDITTPAYGCRDGDVFIKGVTNGQVSVAAENYVYVTGNLTYASTQDDLLGLVGTNGVLVWNPVNSSGGSLIGDTNRTIQAAILSTAHTFEVQMTLKPGLRGTLNVYGSIAQKFRGGVARGDNSGNLAVGYVKNYVYDPRLADVAPPDFLTPTVSSFEVSRYAAVASAFTSNGASSS